MVSKDFTEALRLFKLAAGKGCCAAQFNLGTQASASLTVISGFNFYCITFFYNLQATATNTVWGFRRMKARRVDTSSWHWTGAALLRKITGVCMLCVLYFANAHAHTVHSLHLYFSNRCENDVEFGS